MSQARTAATSRRAAASVQGRQIAVRSFTAIAHIGQWHAQARQTARRQEAQTRGSSGE
jgi:hypothetical protein